MTIIGKSRAALTMICDVLSSQQMGNEIKIYNNLNIQDVFIYHSFIFKETNTLDDKEYILGAVMPETKKRLVELFPLTYQSLINNSAFTSINAKTGMGSIVDSLVSIAGCASIGKYVTMYANSSIAHDSIIGDFVTISPNVAVCGNVKIGEGSFIGAGSIIKNGITIGKNCIIGCGSNVIKDIEDGRTVYGNPAK